MFKPRTHQVERGKGVRKEREEMERDERFVSGRVECVCEEIDAPSMLRL
jgi:hypothetical protein